jgi:hypothetical protein
MKFWQISDAIQLRDQPHHHDGHYGLTSKVPTAFHSSPLSAIGTSDDQFGNDGSGFLFANKAAHAAAFDPLGATHGEPHGKALPPSSDRDPVKVDGGPDPGVIHTGTNEAGNGGDGFFYGGIIHASLAIYEPINVAVAVGYDAVAIANQSNDLNLDQSALQMAGIGGNGGNANTASGGNVDPSFGFDAIGTGSNNAGNAGSGYFFGNLLDSPTVIYNPINIAYAGAGATAHAGQSNTADIDQSATQIAGVGGNGGNDNAASGGNVAASGSPPDSVSSRIGSELIHTGSEQVGNGGEGFFHGSLVHTSVAVYEPINISVAGYNTGVHAFQANNVHIDQSSFQMAGIGGNGGNGNEAAGGSTGLVFFGKGGGSDAIATGETSAGNGGNGHFSGSLIDISVTIYAPVNIAIAGPYSTAVADQVNNVHIDQSAVQIAGIGGDGGHGNIALGGDIAMHLPSDFHLLS